MTKLSDEDIEKIREEAKSSLVKGELKSIKNQGINHLF